MPVPSGFIDYAVKFDVRRLGWRWRVVSIWHWEGRLERPVMTFWRQRTAMRVAAELTKHYRTGWDMGKAGTAIYGGGRAA